MRVYPDDKRFDWGGVALLASTLTAFVLAVNQGHMWGIRSPAFISSLLMVLLLLPLLFWWEGGQPSPLLDLALLRRRAFSAGNLAGLFSYAMLFGMFFLMPFVFERAFGESALAAGLQLMVIPVALGIMTTTYCRTCGFINSTVPATGPRERKASVWPAPCFVILPSLFKQR